MRKRILLVLILLTSSVAIAQKVTYERPPENVINEFRFLGGALACITDEEGGNYLPCLHLGDISIGSSKNEVEQLYDNIYKSISKSDSVEIKVYILHSELEELPYLVITYENEKVKSIQLTGLQTSDDLDFSSIELGAPSDSVVKILGNPSSKQEVQEIQGTRWSYDPFTISIEFVKNKVYSIKIWRP